MLRQSKAQKANEAGVKRASGNDRRRELIRIAFEEIAGKGFEGLRFQEVAARAGITNATLYYYFPSKELLIQALVDSLMDDLKTPLEQRNAPAENALEELRRLFDQVRLRVTKDARFFIVITELALRARRDPAIDSIGRQRDDFWQRDLRSILARGIAEGLFRKDLDVDATVLALMVQVKGIGHHAAMRKRKAGEIDRAVDEIAAQVEHWLTRGMPRHPRPRRRSLDAL